MEEIKVSKVQSLKGYKARIQGKVFYLSNEGMRAMQKGYIHTAVFQEITNKEFERNSTPDLEPSRQDVMEQKVLK